MPHTRRAFLATAAAASTLRAADPPVASTPPPPPNRNIAADVVIIGGSTGGVAAALAACRAGAKKVVMTEETTWIGGQLTSQLVPPDENKWIEGGGSSQSYQDYREAVRQVYRTRTDKPLKVAFKDRPNLNPGNGWVSRLCHEPIVGLAVLERMLAPFVEKGQLVILRQTKATAAETDGDKVTAVLARDFQTGTDLLLTGKYFLDATDEGDLLPMAKVEHVTGTESAAETGEPSAADKPRPGNVQAFSWCFALEHRDGEDHAIDKPREYDFWKGRFDWDKYSFYPKGDKDPGRAEPNFWTYRRVIDSKMFTGYAGDVSVVNWHHNDYDLGSSHAAGPEAGARHRARSREMSLALVYWLQTACPRSDGKTGWPGLRLCPEQTGTNDGLALAPYIRESRRIKAQFTVLQQHVAKSLRGKQGRAEVYPDSVGIGQYLYIDIHKTCEGYTNGGGGEVFPFQIPLGALLPVRVRNLLAACKNLGVTHLTNGCYRLHPIEWNVGEAAGALAAFCAAKGCEPRQVRETPQLLADYQAVLTGQGVRIAWPASAVKG